MPSRRRAAVDARRAKDEGTLDARARATQPRRPTEVRSYLSVAAHDARRPTSRRRAGRRREVRPRQAAADGHGRAPARTPVTQQLLVGGEIRRRADAEQSTPSAPTSRRVFAVGDWSLRILDKDGVAAPRQDRAGASTATASARVDRRAEGRPRRDARAPRARRLDARRRRRARRPRSRRSSASSTTVKGLEGIGCRRGQPPGDLGALRLAAPALPHHGADKDGKPIGTVAPAKQDASTYAMRDERSRPSSRPARLHVHAARQAGRATSSRGHDAHDRRLTAGAARRPRVSMPASRSRTPRTRRRRRGRGVSGSARRAGRRAERPSRQMTDTAARRCRLATPGAVTPVDATGRSERSVRPPCDARRYRLPGSTWPGLWR